MSEWHAVPCLVEGRNQLDDRFPTREKGAEGFIGDTSHQGSSSSHNPDETGRPEFSDHDGSNEVRAWDADKDLRDPMVTMEQVVQHLVEGVRAGRFWWIRYIIFNGRIWHRRDNFVTRTYTGSNKHGDHAHVNSDFTQQADTVTGTDWEFDKLGQVRPPASSPTPGSGTRELKRGMKGADVRNLQELFRRTFPAYRFFVKIKKNQMISVDGDFGPQTEAWIKEFQRRVGLKQDGIVGPNTRGKLRNFGFTS